MKSSITTVLALVLVSACLMAQPVHADAPGQTGTIKYEGKTIQVSIGEIGKDDKGNTTVQILTDFEVAGKFDISSHGAFDTAFAAVGKALRAKIIVKNKTVEADTFSSQFSMGRSGTKFSEITYQFNTTALPEKIIVYNEKGAKLTFNGKTKKIIK